VKAKKFAKGKYKTRPGPNTVKAASLQAKAGRERNQPSERKKTKQTKPVTGKRKSEKGLSTPGRRPEDGGKNKNEKNWSGGSQDCKAYS